MEERVQKLMAQANIGSRRSNESLIEQGRVTVNGKTIKLGDKADPSRDIIEVDGQRLHISQNKIYIAINKQLNVVSTNQGHPKDDRLTIRELIPVEGHLFTIGRLDAESTGLMVMTNDGELTNKLTHPKFRHTRTYSVQVYGLPPREVLDRWENGIELEDGMTAPCLVRVKRGDRDMTTLEIVMIEGKNRQIRRIASALGYPVHQLKRTHMGRLELGNLHPGEHRTLTEKEVELLQLPSEDYKLLRSKISEANRNRPSTPRARFVPSQGRIAPMIGRKPIMKSTPRKDEEDASSQERGGESSDRPSRPYSERRGESSDRPSRPYSERRGESSDRSSRPYSERRGESSDRPSRPYSESRGESSDRPSRPYSERRGESSSDRPSRP